MRFPFQELPGQAGPHVRPVLPVTFAGTRTSLLAMADTGALHNRFARVLAPIHGIRLPDGEEQFLALGGFRTGAVTVPVRLRLGDVRWEAPVSFCDPWPLDFQLLGQEGFFRFFDVTVRAAEFSTEVLPARAR